MTILELKQVSLATAIGSRYLLQDISFTVSSGDRIVIIGASGAGKTSLLRLLNRLQETTNGSIELDNQPFNKISAIQLRQQVVLVPQEAKLLGMRVRETLAYPLVLQQLPKREIQQRIETWRTKLHIPEAWLERNELELSLGQRQLVTIARALIMQPKILLLDEPTSALDVGSANHLIEVLAELADTSQMAIIMVNHQLELAQKFARRVIYLQQGQLLEDKDGDRVDWLQLRDNLNRIERQKMVGDEFDEF
ncbi:MAG: ATP-binding cassette domain-containing protein [Hydrococcus sp. Prado102]|jgi:D-methionine transport system ATP-binding protein|nr:ATP-binding cassette domain-containing protein [Hydrococcus sp. Prado102]